VLFPSQERWSFLKKSRKPARREPKDSFFSAAPTYPAMAGIHPWAPETKVFWFFSSEKNTLP